MQNKQIYRGGFALPTVLIASVVMLIVLSVSVSSVVSVRTALKSQYYEQLAKAAGEAGVAYAKACLAKSGNVPLWTDEKPLRPSTDCAGNSLLNPEVQVLVVAGGGGGGNNHGGGGGGGGVVTNNAFTVSGGQSYAVSVGGGGSGGTPSGGAGARGANSSFTSLLVAQGGGGGGGRVASNNVSQSGTGGSGGGGAGTIDGATNVPAAGANGTTGQGFAGGNGSSGTTAGNGGGGGGAGGSGGAATGISGGAGISGDGGSGYFSDISGAVLYYGGGGSGGRWASGAVGLPGINGGGVGGDNDSVAGKPGQANTGGGGGGGGGGAANGGAGGSGVVYVRYANNGTINASGGSVASYTVGPYRVHAFRNTGASTFTVNSATSSVCPSDPRCSVVVNESLRSSFSVPRPTVDASGQALTIANTGYVELLRTSTGAVWRTYRQPAVQAAAVPDLCSGSAASGLGWQNAIVSTTKEAIPNASSAKTVTLADTSLVAGSMYFRKDFSILEAGSYDFSLLTTNGAVRAESYINGNIAITSAGGLATASTNLGVGCHTITVQLINQTLTPTPARFTASLGRSGAAPIVATDTSWRVSSGSSVHFSQSDFYADSAIWGGVVNYVTPAAQSVNASWSGTSGDPFTQMIAPAGNNCPSECPANSSGYLRDSQDIYVDTPTEVTVTALCDNDCAVYMNGQTVLASAPWSAINQQTLTLTPGYHRFAVRLFNSAVTGNPAGAGVSVVQKNGSVLTRTDLSWQGANQWTSGMNATTANIQSYEKSFRPSPDEIPVPITFDLLLVGGGGGAGANAAGGGGAGGVLVQNDLQAKVNTTYTITVGAGGAGAASHTTNGTRGGNTVFGTFVVIGGGYGASRDGGLAAATGGSGGGGAGAKDAFRVPGAAGTTGRGTNGGNGVTADAGVNATGGGGGGAGGPGVAGISGGSAGNGGPGYITYMTGNRLAVGGGGAGSITSAGTVGLSTDGGGNLASANAAANTGGGGGARSNVSVGGNGGSGVVIVRVKTGSMNVSITGSPVTTQVTIQGVTYTIYRFNSNGSFRINSLN